MHGGDQQEGERAPIDTHTVRVGEEYGVYPSIGSYWVGQLAQVTVDQRGVTRPIGPTCDIGAYEAPVFLKYYLTVVMR